MGGYPDGTFRPDSLIMRAEFLALVNRAFGYTEMQAGQVSGSVVPVTFRDVGEMDWYGGEIAKAVAAGYIEGYPDGTIRPQNPITRQEVAALFARILPVAIEHSETDQVENPELNDNPDFVKDDALKAFTDETQIPEWSREAIAQAVSGGCMNGYPDGTLRPAQAITRAEAVTVIEHAVGTLYNHAGTYGPFQGNVVIEGNVTVTTPGVTLQNTTITGNLYLTAGVGEGDVTLDHVTVQGTTKIGGGGSDSIHLRNTTLGQGLVNVPNRHFVRILAEGSTTVGTLEARTPARLEESELTASGFSRVRINNQQETPLIVELSGELDQVEIHSSAVQLNVQKGRINSITLTSASQAPQKQESAQSAQSMQSVQINLAAQTTVASLIADTPVVARGQGTIETTEANVEGVVIETLARNVLLVDGVHATVAGGTITENYQYVEPKKKKSNDATLSDLILVRATGRATISGFAPDLFSYEVVLPYGTDENDLLLVEAMARHAKAKVEITQATGFAPSNNTATIVVTAESGRTQTYTVTVTVLPSTDTSLKVFTIGTEVVYDVLELTSLTDLMSEAGASLAVSNLDDLRGITVETVCDDVQAVTVTVNGETVENLAEQVIQKNDEIVVTVVAEDGNAAQYTVKVVPILVMGISLNKAVAFINGIATEEILTATVEPAEATNKDVTWESDDEEVAVVNQDGVVTAIALGTAKITVTTLDGGYTANCWVRVVAPDSITPVIDDSCVLYLDGSVGNTSASDTWYDISGKGNHGTLHNFTGAEGSGWTEQGLQFDGVDDYVQLPDLGSLSSYTVSCWFCSTGQGSIGQAFYNTIIGSGSRNRLLWRPNTLLAQMGGWNLANHLAEISLEYGEWGYFTYTYDAITQNATWFFNGDKKTESIGERIIDAHALKLGAYDLINYMHKGFMRDIAIYNRVLLPEEITQNYLAAQDII